MIKLLPSDIHVIWILFQFFLIVVKRLTHKCRLRCIVRIEYVISISKWHRQGVHLWLYIIIILHIWIRLILICWLILYFLFLIIIWFFLCIFLVQFLFLILVFFFKGIIRTTMLLSFFLGWQLLLWLVVNLFILIAIKKFVFLLSVRTLLKFNILWLFNLLFRHY